jgi:hypothetical protein
MFSIPWPCSWSEGSHGARLLTWASTLRLFPVAASRAVTVLHCLFVLATEVKVKAHPARRAVSQSVSRKHKHVKWYSSQGFWIPTGHSQPAGARWCKTCVGRYICRSCWFPQWQTRRPLPKFPQAVPKYIAAGKYFYHLHISSHFIFPFPVFISGRNPFSHIQIDSGFILSDLKHTQSSPQWFRSIVLDLYDIEGMLWSAQRS